MTFNIGNQNAGTINNVEGDQNVRGGQRATIHVHQDVRQGRDALAGLWSAIDASPEAAEDTLARGEIVRIDDALRGPEPDRMAAASALERLTRRLASLGALAAAGASFVGPIRALAQWLGPVADSVSAMLPL